MEVSYRVKFENFEGPLDLLLDLIEKEKLDITNLSLAKVADDYLEYINRQGSVSLANLSEFLLTASQLILIKSKALLPLFEFTKEEEEEIGDLQERLRIYQLYRQTAEKIGSKFKDNQKYFSKPEEEVLFFNFTPPKISKDDLRNVFSKIINEIPKQDDIAQEVMKEVISLEEKIIQIRQTLEQRMKMAFHETIKQAGDKIEVVVSFLAMLEMIKQKVINVRQETLFSDIMIEKRN